MLPGYYILNTDGGMASSGRRRSGDPPGPAAVGAVLRTPRLAPLDDLSKAIGPASHHAAEYRGLIEGLKLARKHSIKRIRVYMDSELVVDQMNRLSAVKNDDLKALNTCAREIADSFESIRFAWVPREMNVEADRLARKVLAQLR
jgi:ribonuclease HI